MNFQPERCFFDLPTKQSWTEQPVFLFVTVLHCFRSVPSIVKTLGTDYLRWFAMR